MRLRDHVMPCVVNVVGCALALAFGPVPPSAAHSSQEPRARTLDELRVSPPGTATRSLQVRLRWTTDKATINTAATRNHFELVSVERLATPARAPRTSEIGPDTLVVVGETAQGHELSWRIVLDPRVVRSETSSTPALRGERLVYLQAELLLALPDISGTARVRIYKPRRHDGHVVLDDLGTAALR